MNSLPRLLGARATEQRRSSAAGLNVVSQRPPLPPKIELRSHSYDGLLDDSASMQRRKVAAVVPPAGTKVSNVTEGHDRADGRDANARQQEAVDEARMRQSPIARKVFVEPSGSSVGTDASIKSKNRRSRSMDDLFDDDEPGVECKFLDNTQSMETLLEPVSPTSTNAPECAAPETPPVRSTGGNICLNRRFVREESGDRPDDPVDDSLGSHTASHEQLCEKETITVDSTPRFPADGPASPDLPTAQPNDQDQDQDDIESTHSSVTSSHGSAASGEKGSGTGRKAPKPLINRYVKKVKSFMKM